MSYIKMRIRRRMAVTSFITLIASIFSILAMAFFGSSEVGENLLKATGLLAPLFLCLTAIVSQYNHQSHQNDKTEKETS